MWMNSIIHVNKPIAKYRAVSYTTSWPHTRYDLECTLLEVGGGFLCISKVQPCVIACTIMTLFFFFSLCMFWGPHKIISGSFWYAILQITCYLDTFPLSHVIRTQWNIHSIVYRGFAPPPPPRRMHTKRKAPRQYDYANSLL